MLIGSYNLLGEFDFIVKYASLSLHFDEIKKGIIVTKDIIYLVSIIVVFLTASLTVIKTLKK
jgi:ABC-2 type transport system permease protein